MFVVFKVISNNDNRYLVEFKIEGAMKIFKNFLAMACPTKFTISVFLAAIPMISRWFGNHPPLTIEIAV